jgi:hypothetical protein
LNSGWSLRPAARRARNGNPVASDH